ncbi:MAG: glycine cleavage system protein GcvH [Gammaproteobacteria bacterium]|jgi:glycine cleavage system H protein|nr:glycine cleavage system protein GcvH [Gammaproteobacteria bacterium]
MTIPAHLKYIDTHEWVKVEGDEAVIGLTDHAQAALGDVVYVELPRMGQEIHAQASVGVVESVKAASEIYSPLSGTVLAINHEVVTDPSLINSDPYAAAWLYRVRISHPVEVDLLLDAAAYEAIAG